MVGGGKGPTISSRERLVLSSAIVVATIAILFSTSTLTASAAPLIGRESTEALSSCSTSRQPTICGWENITAQGPGGYYVCTGPNGNEFSSGPVYTDVSLVARASGGSPPYTFTWNFLGEANNTTGARVTENFSQPYPPLVNVSVQDSQGEKNWLFIQSPVPGTPRIDCPFYPFSTVLFFLTVIAVVLALVIAITFLRRRRRRLKTRPSKPI